MDRFLVFTVVFILTEIAGYSASSIVLLTADQTETVSENDSIAEKMLIYQRESGGWPQLNGNPLNYNMPITDSLRRAILKDRKKKDSNIDDRTTTREINYLVDAFEKTKNKEYLRSAERGITYLLEAQNPSGGWPQYYPDSSGYRKHITFNDNAMVNVLWVMKNITDRQGAFKNLDPHFFEKAEKAMNRGIECILRCQIVSPNGTLTAWCAQHDSKTLAPAKARAYELPSISGLESVNIALFLMAIPSPSASVVRAVTAAAKWFERAKLPGIALKFTQDDTGKKYDTEVVSDSSSVLWGRFYDLKTNLPFFTGRDGVPRSRLSEIERERRKGYGYYTSYPREFLENQYPAWKKEHGL